MRGRAPLLLVLGVTALGLGWAGQARAIINVDYGNTSILPPFLYSGQGALGQGGNTWNDGHFVASHTNLVDSNGVATSVDSAVTGSPVDPGFGNSSPPTSSNALTGDYAFIQSFNLGRTFTLTISDLNASLTYDLYLYGYQAALTGRGTEFTIDSVTKTTDGDFNAAGTGFLEGSTHVIFSGLSPNGSNEIVVDMKPEVDNIAFLNGFQLQTAGPPVPALGNRGIAVFAILLVASFVWGVRRQTARRI